MTTTSTGSLTRRWRAGWGFALVLCAGTAAPTWAQEAPRWTPMVRSLSPQVLSTLPPTVHDDDGPGPIPPAFYPGIYINETQGQPVRNFIGPSLPDEPRGLYINTHVRLSDQFWRHPPPGLERMQRSPTWQESYVTMLMSDQTVSPPELWAEARVTLIEEPNNERATSILVRRVGNRWESVLPNLGGVAGVGYHTDPVTGRHLYMMPGPTFWAGGTPNQEGIVRRSGQGWVRVGDGLQSPFRDAYCRVMHIFDDDGPGPMAPSLYVSGVFWTSGAAPMKNLARWDGVQWSRVGDIASISQSADAMATFDADGDGPEPGQLYIGGGFIAIKTADGVIHDVFGLIRWNGQSWSRVPGWEHGNVYAMAVWDDDGPGPNEESLFVAGNVFTVNGMPVQQICRWDGQRWYTLGSGIQQPYISTVGAQLTPFDDDGDGPNPGGLYVTGDIWMVENTWTMGLARWGIPLPEPCFADCDRAGPGYRVLDIFDFLCFQTRFAAGDPYACDADTSTGPRVCDLFDFLYFQNAFAAGCP